LQRIKLTSFTNVNDPLVAAKTINFEEPGLVAGTKQSRQADKAVGLCLLIALALLIGYFYN
jgi:hypothetical protein